jgi:hypothetical protein
VTPTAAIVALALGVHPPLSLVREAERLDLPTAASGVRLEAHPFTREWILYLPPAAIPATIFRLRGASRLCPEVTAGSDRITLRCSTSRIRADVVKDGAGAGLSLFRLSVPSWRPQDEGPPLVPFDLVALGLGPCPGHSPDVAGECALASGDLDTARELFQRALAAGPSPLAHLRLGDLALRDDAPESAVEHWRLAKAEAPWGRLASARMCELDAKCLASESSRAVFDDAAVDHPLRADVVFRRARLIALEGGLLDTARRLASESSPGGACQASPGWCRRLLLQALELEGPAGMEALGAYLDLYGRREGPLSLELARAAAAQAEHAGAPAFGANLLASFTGVVCAQELEAHLRRVAQLYLAGGDRARADEIARYARSRLGEAAMRAAPWNAIRRAVRTRPGPAASDASAAPEDPDLAAARAALAAARLVQASPTPKGAKP